MFSDKPFKLGNIVYSPVYGITGTATAFYYNTSEENDRVPQVYIQPFSTDATKIADGCYIDTNLVDYESEGCVNRLTPPIVNPFKPGDQVKDKISGFEGTVTGSMIMMNGCVDVKISPNKLDKDGKIIESRLFAVVRVEKIETKFENLDDPKDITKPKKTLIEKAKEFVTSETHTTDPAKRPTGAAMHRGENIRRG